MPTPSSSHALDPRPHPFASTCPDDQQDTQPPSPSSWHPLPPPPYNNNASQVIVGLPVSAGLLAAESPESLESPQSPESRPTSSSDVDGPSSSLSREETVETSMTTEEDDDALKAAEQLQEDMARLHSAADDEAAMSGSGAPSHQDGVLVSRSYGSSSRRRRAADVPSSLRGRRRAQDESGEDDYMPADWEYDSSVAGHVFSQLRIIPTTPSSYLRPGSKFYGTQQSERQVYDVQVEIKHVDLRESFLCGYLRIQGLTEDHPTLTTYFEGEIIGSKYSFITKNESWGANDKTDLTHWSKFAAFKPLAKAAKKGGAGAVIKDVAQREHIFMRWKEHFLVPDHRVRTINGASFEGFYYICFNQIKGDVTGIYFHSKSEKFQQLELKHVEDRGCYSALEFR